MFTGALAAQTGSGDKANIAATSAALSASHEDPAAVARGAKLFAANCASCHGATAKGLTGKDNTDLVRSLYVLDDEKASSSPRQSAMAAPIKACRNPI